MNAHLAVPALALVSSACGLLAAVGLLIAFAGTYPPPETSGPRRAGGLRSTGRWLTGAGLSARDRTVRHAQLTVAALAAAGAWLVTAVPALGLIAAAGVLGLPSVLAVGGSGKARIAKLDALASWTRSLATRISAGTSLEQALIASPRDAAAPIYSEVKFLSELLLAGQPAADALSVFAEQLADGTADFVAAALSRAAVRRGSGLSRSLVRLSDAVDQQVSMWRRIEAERARPRVTARLVTGIAVAAFIAMQADGQFMKPYRSPLGQLVLLAVAGGFAGCLAWMAVLTRGRVEPRLLGAEAEAAPVLKNFGKATT